MRCCEDSGWPPLRCIDGCVVWPRPGGDRLGLQGAGVPWAGRVSYWPSSLGTRVASAAPACAVESSWWRTLWFPRFGTEGRSLAVSAQDHGPWTSVSCAVRGLKGSFVRALRFHSFWLSPRARLLLAICGGTRTWLGAARSRTPSAARRVYHRAGPGAPGRAPEEEVGASGRGGMRCEKWEGTWTGPAPVWGPCLGQPGLLSHGAPLGGRRNGLTGFSLPSKGHCQVTRSFAFPVLQRKSRA